MYVACDKFLMTEIKLKSLHIHNSAPPKILPFLEKQ